MARRIPSPTRAIIVSSVAPPINWLRLARTVTRALDLQLDAADAVERLAAHVASRAVDHLGIDARLHGLQHVAAGQVDRRGQFEREGIFALRAAMIARITAAALPPAR